MTDFVNGKPAKKVSWKVIQVGTQVSEGMINYGHEQYNQIGEAYRNGSLGLNKTNNDIQMEEQLALGLERQKLSFHQAARYGNEPIVRKYLQKYRGKKRKINKLNRQEMSALHYAVRHGHMNIIDLLLGAKADINLAGPDGAMPIHFAAKYFKTEKHMAISVASKIGTEIENSDVQEMLKVATVDQNFMSQDTGIQEVEELLPEAIVNKDVEDVISFLLNHGADVNATDNYNQTPLNYAAVKGNIEAVTLLLKWAGSNAKPDGCKISIKDTSGATPLHNACGNGHTQSAKLLLLAGAELMVWDNERMNPLHYAATGDGSKILREILEGIEGEGGFFKDWSLSQIINDKNCDGETILHLAVGKSDYETCCLVIQKKADVNCCRNGFVTPLHLAAASRSLEITKLLVASDADLEAQNEDLQTPLHKAARNNRVEIVKFLLSKECEIDAYDNENNTPLMLAVINGHKDTVEVLLANDADMTIVDLYEKSVIYCAAEENSEDVLRLLLEKKKQSNELVDMINQTDRFENTPLHAAAQHGFIHVVILLLDYGADIDVWNDEDNTPLHLACIHGNRKVAKLLLSKKLSIINDDDESGNTPLHLAALNGHHKIIDMLIEYGASVDPRNTLQWTPLDCAAAKGYHKCVHALLEQDAPIDPTDIARTTPLHLASQEGHHRVVKELLDNGADIILRDHMGRNALDMAIEQSHKKTTEILLGHKEWLTLMRNRTKYGKVINSPMRQMIIKMPETAYMVLNKCMDLRNTVPMDSEEYKVKFFYDFIDDTYSDWDPDSEQKVEDDARSTAGDSASSLVENELDANALTPEVVELLERKDNHPIYLMSKHKQSNLLNHPLVLSLIYHKWQSFGRAVFYSKFCIYFLFLFFLTGYVLVTKPLLPKLVQTSSNTTRCVPTATDNDRDSTITLVFFSIGRIVVLVLACIQLCLELLQLINRRLSYISDLTNWMEWLIYFMAIFFVLPPYDRVTTSSDMCKHDNFYINIGAVTIFLAWMDLLLFIQKFPSLGIYVVMFTDVTKTFLKFSITFLLFIFAFGFSFYFLLAEKFQTFHTTGRSFVKTIVMMIGEFDYDDIFSDDTYRPPTAARLIFVLFVLIMTILLMNLMVGLAVDDIKGVLDMAVLTRVAMQAHLVLDVEKTLPYRIRRKYVIKDKTIYPNQDGRWNSIISHITKMDEIQEALHPTKSVTDIVVEHTGNIKDSVNNLQQESLEMKKQIRNIEQMLERLLKHSNVNDDDDDDVQWDL